MPYVDIALDLAPSTSSVAMMARAGVEGAAEAQIPLLPREAIAPRQSVEAIASTLPREM